MATVDFSIVNSDMGAVLMSQRRFLKPLLFVTVTTVLFLGPMIPGLASARFLSSEPGFLYFFNMRFSVNFPNDWKVIENLPNTVHFMAPDITSGVIINWGSPAPSWILDKSAWISNMTKQGIIVDRIDNTTTIANNTGLVISFIDNDLKYSVALVKVHNLVLDLVYFAHVDDFPTYEDKANTMLSTLHSNGWEPTFQDSRCPYNTLFTNFDWWSGWKSSTC
jgi:hypothetical protein